ncbi:selenium-dependent molybdenum cofactor biosynthesis protein YqeB [Desulfocicer niacini]
MNSFDLVVGVKGAGELATGIACRLHQSNIRKIFMMEIEKPLAVRRNVAFCDVIYTGNKCVEGVGASKVETVDDIEETWGSKKIAVIVDPEWHFIEKLYPDVVIDATIAKRNLGTTMKEAPLVIGVGPGFDAGKTVHVVIESNRGHNLGRLISAGQAEANTGIPGSINGFARERVLRAPSDGEFVSDIEIGTMVKSGAVVGKVNGDHITTEISGVVRGLIRSGTVVKSGLKIGDVDPRGVIAYCDTISDKSRAISGGVLEAIMRVMGTSDGFYRHKSGCSDK